MHSTNVIGFFCKSLSEEVLILLEGINLMKNNNNTVNAVQIRMPYYSSNHQ